MFRRRTARDPEAVDIAGRTTTVERDETIHGGHAWSPAQIVAFVIGAAALAFGIVALVRTGLDLDDLTGAEADVLGFTHTALLALAEIGFGALMLLAALSPAGRPFMALLGAIVLAFGILILVDAWPARLHDWFGVADRNGWLFVVVGGVSLAAALFLPTVRTSGRRRVTERRPVGDRPHTVH